jgi:membrane-associated phospholipid phosphatase
MNGFWSLGIDTVVWLQTNAAFLAPLMQALSFFGTTEFLLLLGLIFYWCVDVRTGVRLGFLLIAGAGLGGILKLAFHMPRPYWYDARVQALSGESTYGMPSMHALYAWSIAPWLGKLTLRGWGLAAGALLAVGISISRIFLGVHFPGDVLAGFAIGILGWVGVDLGIRFIGPVLMRAGFLAQCIAAFLASALLLIVQTATLRGLASSPDPAVWAENAARINAILPRNPNPIISLAGLILGMGVGLACKHRWAPFSAEGGIEKKFLRLLLGLSVALILLGGLAFLWNGVDQPLGPVLRYMRYGLVGWWIIFLAPWLFVRWKLADRVG